MIYNTNILSKIKNFFMAILALSFVLLRGRAKRIDHDPKKIVILRWTPHMGDVVYTTPMFRAVKEKYPGCKVYVAGRGRVEEVIRHNPDIDGFIEYTGFAFWSVVKKIRREKFDFGCVAKPGASKGFALLYLGGVKAISLFNVFNEPKVKSATYPFLLRIGIPIPFYNHQ